MFALDLDVIYINQINVQVVVLNIQYGKLVSILVDDRMVNLMYRLSAQRFQLDKTHRKTLKQFKKHIAPHMELPTSK
jgi:hypothetical protein